MWKWKSRYEFAGNRNFLFENVLNASKLFSGLPEKAVLSLSNICSHKVWGHKCQSKKFSPQKPNFRSKFSFTKISLHARNEFIFLQFLDTLNCLNKACMIYIIYIIKQKSWLCHLIITIVKRTKNAMQSKRV
jgi:hypothetical protein